jgi:hypothetical protein
MDGATVGQTLVSFYDVDMTPFLSIFFNIHYFLLETYNSGPPENNLAMSFDVTSERPVTLGMHQQIF